MVFKAIKNLFRSDAARQRAEQLATQVAVQRQPINATAEAYRWARRDRRTEAFQPQAATGDMQIAESHDLMHRRIRAQVLNTAQIKRIVQALADLVVGCGVQTFSWPFAPWEATRILKELKAAKAGNLNPRLRFALEADDLFETWWHDEKQIDVEGKRTGPELQRDLLRECVQVGNGFLMRVVKRQPGTLIPLCYQLIERDQLDTTLDRPAEGGQNKIVNGVEVDPANRIVAYHFMDAHPYDSYASTYDLSHSTRVPADRVIDLCLFHRPSASIGASWLDAVAQTSFDRDSFLDAELKSAVKGALLALIHKTKTPHLSGLLGMLDDDDDSEDEYGNEEVKLGNSPLAIQCGLDESVEMVESQRPNNQAQNFFKLLDRDTAAGAGVSVYTLTGDYESTNYSSVRAAKLDEDLHVRPLQQWFGAQVALPIRREFNRLAAAAGLYETLRPAQFKADERTYQRFDSIGPGRDLLDPFKETEAAKGKLGAGLTTLKIECARRGLHWIRVLLQQAIERGVAEMLEVKLDWATQEQAMAEDGQQPDEKKREATSAAKS